ncbi:NAD(P)/FAD-dependent oxidoreductase [Microbispora sp. H10885]|uniref:NAD(P)/FAD-dependent oxidoreductase n=1 Tax=Microbispora sp. H10885 TaxID=2729110 RepID=UPI001604674C|nr:FAD-dependent monooxygenase [Microbispora sp. H10885]
MTHAAIIGGGMAGMLAATAIARHVDRVTIIESDTFPTSPAQRRGLPQGHHNHMLFGGGAMALDTLLPKTTDLLYAHGAHHLRIGERMAMLSPQGWSRRFDGDPFVVTCSRPLLDHVIRRQALSYHRITLIQSAKVVGLTGDASRVTGVRVERDGGPAETIEADLVVDAAGRRSDSPRWLTDLGLPEVAEDTLDAGFAYAGRSFLAPPSAGDDFPGILIQADNSTGEPGRGAALLPNEDGRWIVALIGTRGAHPPTDEEGWLEFARGMRSPIIADLLAGATPLGEIRAYRGLANRRRHFERIVPEGFVVLGDAAMTLNPNYATGMSISAFGALALREEVERTGFTDGLARRAQQRIAKAGEPWWEVAIGQDRWFPNVRTNLTLRGGPSQLKMAARWGRVVTEHPAMARATYSAASLVITPKKMMTLPLLVAMMRGPKLPPLTADEAIAQYPGFSGVLDAAPADSAVSQTTA